VIAVGDGAETPVPLLLDRPLADETLAYVCQNLICGLPVATTDELISSL
jgi:hypothetical protein